MVVGAVTLGGIVLVPAVFITGVFSHLAANRKITKIAVQEARGLADIEQCRESELILGAFGRRVEEVDISVDKVRSTFEIEFARVYKLLFPYGLLSKLFKYIRRHLFKKDYFGEADLIGISHVIQMAQELACLIDQKLLDESGNIL